MDKFKDMFKGKKRTGFIGAAIAVVTIISALGTLKRYKDKKK